MEADLLSWRVALRRRILGIRDFLGIWHDNRGRLRTIPRDAAGNPSLQEQIRSPYYWLLVLAFGAAILIWLTANPGWLHAVAAVLYVVGLLASVGARRDARAIGLRSRVTDEK